MAAVERRSDPSSADDPEEAFAVEALRQAQKLVESQIATSTALDSKLTSVMQAAIGLTSASLAAGAATIGGKDALMPGWAGYGLLAAAATWGASAGIAAYGLRSAELSAPGLQPSKLLEAGLDSVPLPRAFMAIAWTLDQGFQENSKTSKRAALILGRALRLLLLGPWIGAILAAAIYGLPHTRWLLPPGIIIASGLLLQRWLRR